MFRIALDIEQSVARIHRACTVDADKNQCGRTGFRETGRVSGNVAGGMAGAFIAFKTCNLIFAVPSAGSSLLWCGIVVGATSGYLASNYLSSKGEEKGNILYETLISLEQ